MTKTSESAPTLREVIQQAMDEWRMGYDPADTGPTMAEAVAAALRALPAEQRMEAMGMEPADAFGLGITWQEKR